MVIPYHWRRCPHIQYEHFCICSYQRRTHFRRLSSGMPVGFFLDKAVSVTDFYFAGRFSTTFAPGAPFQRRETRRGPRSVCSSTCSHSPSRFHRLTILWGFPASVMVRTGRKRCAVPGGAMASVRVRGGPVSFPFPAVL